MPGLLHGTDFDRQILIEKKAQEAGRLRYFRDRDKAHEKGRYASTAPGRRWLAHWAVAMTLAIRKTRRANAAEGKKTPSEYTGVYALVSPNKAAAITLTQMLNMLLREPEGVTQQKLYVGGGRAILAQAQLDRWQKEKKKDLLKAMFKKRRKNAIAAMDVNRHAKILDPEAIYDHALCIKVGASFVWDAVGACSCNSESEPFALAFHRTRVGRGKKQRSVFTIDEKIRQTIAHDHQALASISPVYPPMVIPPYKHADSTHGSYITIRMGMLTKSTKAQRQIVRDGIGDLGEFIDGMEALGNTPLRVNKWMLEVIDRLIAEGGDIAGLPASTEFPKPPKPQTEDADVLRDWKRSCVDVHRKNIQNESLFYSVFQCREVAREFQDEPRFYVPHQADFRGRMYARPHYFNHYGGDMERSLFNFAEARDGDDVMRQVAIQAATMYGHDKISFEERVEWVKDNMRPIILSAHKPFETTDFWGKAENPLQFLAACKAMQSREHAVHLPIQRDATASGFQHFVAMTRDATAAPFVNLVENDKPCALYAEIAKRVAVRLEGMEDPENAEALALAEVVVGKHGKDVCKQPVMTTPYGVTPFGARDQIMSKFKKFGIEGEYARPAAAILAKAVLEAVREMFPLVTAAMDWVRTCAGQIAEANRPVMWRTPIGWRCVQPYYAKTSVQVQTCFGNLWMPVDDDRKVNVRKQVSGSAPNFVHGVDAAAMMKTATTCRNQGIAFLAVHDSFWSHAQTAEDVGLIAREQFAAIHQTPLLTDLWLQWREQNPDLELPAPPINGEYDPASVINAAYAMC
mgnify:FL=1